MEKLHNLLDSLASPFKPYATWLLRIGLGVSFFLHGFGLWRFQNPTLSRALERAEIPLERAASVERVESL